MFILTHSVTDVVIIIGIYRLWGTGRQHTQSVGSGEWAWQPRGPCVASGSPGVGCPGGNTLQRTQSDPHQHLLCLYLHANVNHVQNCLCVEVYVQTTSDYSLRGA